MWYLTKPNHPAHPGVIKRFVVQENRAVYVKEEGHSFASDAAQPAFKAWLAQIQDLDRRAKKDMQRPSVLQRGAATAQNAPPQDPAATSGPRREVNITSDSAPGWLPSRDQEQQVLTRTNAYFSALDQQEYQRAYAIMSDGTRSSLSLAQFVERNRQFREKSGPLVRRDILKVTWTKDPAAAPRPGVYAAVDIGTYFSNIDRHCGYVVLYQGPSGGDFEIVREEINYIDNATAAKIEQEKSRAVLEGIWTKMAAKCPNYRPTASPASAH